MCAFLVFESVLFCLYALFLSFCLFVLLQDRLCCIGCAAPKIRKSCVVNLRGQ